MSLGYYEGYNNLFAKVLVLSLTISFIYDVKWWWYVIRNSVEALLTLDKAWKNIQLQTDWKLEQCFRPVQSATNNIMFHCNLQNCDEVGQMPIVTLCSQALCLPLHPLSFPLHPQCFLLFWRIEPCPGLKTIVRTYKVSIPYFLDQ